LVEEDKGARELSRQEVRHTVVLAGELEFSPVDVSSLGSLRGGRRGGHGQHGGGTTEQEKDERCPAGRLLLLAPGPVDGRQQVADARAQTQHPRVDGEAPLGAVAALQQIAQQRFARVQGHLRRVVQHDPSYC